MGASRMARFLGSIWFRRLRCEGPPLPPGPCLILLNHPNGLLDPLAAAALLDRRAGWLAKATLWKLAPLRPFLTLFHAIPVTRPKDGGATAESIQRSFEKVHAVFARGGSVAMFPEGISHSLPDLAPLKTGAARIALSSAHPVQLVPAGLVYGDRATFRHSALLRVGPTIPFEDLKPQGLEPGAVTELTARIRAALLPLTLHDADERRLALAQDVAWLLAEAPGSRVDLEALHHRVRALLPRLAALPSAQLAEIEARVKAAQVWLRTKGLRPDQVGHPYPWADIRRWLPGALARMALAAGLALPLILTRPAYWLVDRLATRFTDEGDQIATLKLLGGLLIHPLWAGLLVGLAVWRWGWPAGLFFLLAMVLLLLGLPIMERLPEDRQALRGFLRRHDPAVPALLQAREELLAAFPELAAGA
jgi:1-acyl-sn-glycerol-3-phosphate acyltransferase